MTGSDARDETEINMADVAGYCPMGCGETLFVGSGGLIACRLIGCPRPGHDSGEVCKHHHRAQDVNGDWQWVFHRAWRFHVHHWKIQVRPLQNLRRWLLTRCEWCGGPSRKGDLVNVSHQWHAQSGPWWRGRRGVFHRDCSSVEHAHRKCVCEFAELSHSNYGQCGRCGLFRAFNDSPYPNAPTRLLKSLPLRSRIPDEMKPRLDELWREVREAKEASA